MREVLFAAAVALWAAACREPPAPGAEKAPAPAPAANVSVLLPEGWVGKLDADQSFMAGPPGRSVLRIDYRKGAAEALPSVDAMRREFELASARKVKELGRTEAEGVRILVLGLTGPVDGGAAGQGGDPVMLGARLSGEDLFLCATLPGASEEDVERAKAACAALKLTVAP